MALKNIRAYYHLRAYEPGPLDYPYTPMWGRIPLRVLDRLSFLAYESQFSGEPLGVFMIRAWEKIRFSHNAMLHALLDMGLVRRITVVRGQESWEWVNRATLSPARSVSEDGTEEGAVLDFSNNEFSPEFFSSVVVAPRISSMDAPAP